MIFLTECYKVIHRIMHYNSTRKEEVWDDNIYFSLKDVENSDIPRTTYYDTISKQFIKFEMYYCPCCDDITFKKIT